DKLIEGLEVSSRIVEKNRKSSKKSEIEPVSAFIEAQSGGTPEIIEERDLHEIKILKTGEIASINVPKKLLAPSELNQFITDLKAIKSKMQELKQT
ncbi:MAG: hypothetical protein GWO20_02610, partial [Candidatus Korarchaeota archaeon]|nr:hypothetical protein [Candidatus Korarchaeota archaeon]NIU82362.1 hypothetical protein [Candidatus Thorarchaeota archaeon]NIW12835.1 hypothetical protein [Candidatus Thorarchaeota archaeon]NIW51032.1 hypothetical protein [Candidatus Korarchaeota archaeon]